MKDTNIIAELRGVGKRFGTVVALRAVDLTVRRGELVALLGPNGAGKTTAVRILLGLIRPDMGIARVCGLDPASQEARLRRGALLQVSKVPETLRVREHIELFSSYYRYPLPFAETIAAAGLGGLESRLFGELSGGQKQRVLFALAICGNPDLLFLDEPSTGLDVEARRALWNRIRGFLGRGTAVLLSTHYMEEAEALAHRVAMIRAGQIVSEGTPAEVKERAGASALEDAFLSLVGSGENL